MTDIKPNPFDLSIFKNCVGLVGNVFAIIFFIAPIDLMMKLKNKEQDPKNTPYLIMTMNVMNCVLWLSFGYLINDYFIMFGNSIGLLLNLIYLCLYFYFRFEKSVNLYVFLSFISNAVAISLFIFLAFVLRVEEVAKYSAMIFNILMYGAPGQKIVI
jgi:hypothetical protein